MKFGKLENNKIVYAPNKLTIDKREIFNPSENTYIKNGWLKIIDEKPIVNDGQYCVPEGWEQKEDCIIRVYKIYDDVQINQPRIFSKLKIVIALTEAGLWEQVKTYIEQNGLYDLYLACNEFSDDNEYFANALKTLKEQLNIDDGIIEHILHQAEVFK